MARSRKPDPPPGAPGVLPQEDATLEERTRYLLQEIGEEAGLLEQWIVHYLAELLTRAEDRKATPSARSEARAEIAGVIPALWEQQIAREALRVRAKADHWYRWADTLDNEAEQLLGALLANPDGAADLAENELPLIFRILRTFTERVTRLGLTTASAEWARQEVTSEAIRRFLQRDEELQGLQAALARVVPEFASLNLADSDAVQGLVHQTLLALTQVQLTLLTRMVPGDLE